MPTPRKIEHADVAAYVLGILDEPDEAAFAQHFAHCPRCRAEFRELSDLPRLLDQLKPHRAEDQWPAAAQSEHALSRALDQVKSQRRGQRGAQWLAAAAAVVLLATVSVLVWRSTIRDTPAASGTPVGASQAQPANSATASTAETNVVAGARTVTGSSRESGVTATITMEPQPWGTKVKMDLRGVTGPLQCQLVAVAQSGYSQPVTSWLVPQAGFGVPGSPEPLRVQGGVGIALEDIDRFEVRRDTGPDLLVIPT